MNERHDYTPVALYARVSSDRQDVDLSVAAQLRALRDYADKNGYMVVREYVDEAESGRIADRPQFRKMLDEATKAEAPFKEILVWKFSRFTRKREHAVAFKSMLRRKGVRVVSITEHADDTPTGKLMEAIIESLDEFYSENLAQEVVRGMREAASRGFWISSHAPFGYNRVMVPDGPKKRPTLETNPDTSRIVKRIFDMAEAAKGTLEITRILNNEGIASPEGSSGARPASTASSLTRRTRALWSGERRPRTRPKRCGWRRRFPPSSPRPSSAVSTNSCGSRAPKFSHPRRVGSSYLLSGHDQVPGVQDALTGRFAKSGQYAYYVCPTNIKVGKHACETPTLNARRFEEMVVNRIRSNILTADCIHALVKVVESEMGGVTRDSATGFRPLDSELGDVRQRLGRLYNWWRHRHGRG